MSVPEFGHILPVEFYARDTVTVARDLLGKVLAHGETAGRIVEVEAYLGVDDLAAHSSRGVTDCTRVIFGPPAHAYVYFIYGMYECLNLIAEPEGTAGCVLIRALEPLSGIELMRERRPKARKLHELTSGPARLTMALGISRVHNGTSLINGPITVHDYPPPAEIITTPRIGITQCADWPLRFYEQGNAFVSGKKLGN